MGTTDAMTGDDVERRLFELIEGWRVPIDARCRVLLEDFVRDGASRCDAERAGEAVENLRLLLADMTQQTRILRFEALHDLAFFSAVERLCPLWPYC